MAESFLRPSRPGDEGALKEIWKLSFHDDDSFLDPFFRDFYTDGMATLMECDGRPVSSIFTLWGAQLLFPGNEPLESPYVYSLGTLPEYRGRGYGALVIQESCRRAYDDGGDFVCFLPASGSLYLWYGEILGTQTCCWVRRRTFASNELNGGGTLEKLSAESYNGLRERLLDGTPHARFNSVLMSWQEHLCNSFGGGLYAVRAGGSLGCACAEYDKGELVIKELLLPGGDPAAAVGAIAQAHPAGAYHLRTPAFWHDDGMGEASDFAVVVCPPGRGFPFTENAYWGFAYD